MKKVISLLLTAIMALSSLSVVFAAEVPTLTIGDVDATAVADGGYVVLPVTIDKFPDGSLKIVQLDFTFDKTKLQFVRSRIKDQSSNPSMQVWSVDPDFPEDSVLKDATWTDTAAATVNANGYGTILFSDSTGTANNFSAAQSLAANNTLVYVYFKKIAGAEGTTTVDFSEVILTDTAADASGISYKKSTNEVLVEAGTVTFTAGPKDVKKVVGYYTGDKLAENDNADTTDTTAAVYAELNGDANTNYKKVNWTVTVDETAGKYTQAVDVTGEATYKFGLVIRGLAADVIDAVDAALAQ